MQDKGPCGWYTLRKPRRGGNGRAVVVAEWETTKTNKARGKWNKYFDIGTTLVLAHISGGATNTLVTEHETTVDARHIVEIRRA
jgi:hypothetical protein